MKQASKKFGFWSIVLLAINSIIGTGIFLSPAGVVKVAGTYTPLVYIFAAVFAGILAVTFAAAAKYTNKNGAAYAYAKVALGSDIGYYVGMTRFVAGAIAWGVMATAVVRTTLGIFGYKATFTQVTIGFVLLMLILLLIVFSGTYVTKIVSNVSTIGKVGALIVAIVAGFAVFALLQQNHFAEVNSIVNPKTHQPYVQPMNLTVFVTAVLSAFYAFTGFESVASAASEMEEPEKNLPRAVPVAIFIIALIYLAIVCIAMVINPKDLIQSEEPVILASAYQNIWIKNIIKYGALLSMFGINVAAAFSTPRIFEAMSSEKQVPVFLSRKNSRGIAVPAFLITAAMAIFVPMAFQYDMRGIMVISSVSRFIQFLVVPIALMQFYKGKNREAALPATRNVVTDFCVPFLAFMLSAFLIVKFDWAGQFTMKVQQGGEVVQRLNGFAVAAMVVGYVILPLILYIPYRMGVYERQEK